MRNSHINAAVVVCDDAGYADLSMHGSEQFKTPRIDSIAAEGVRFAQGYVSSSVCSPSYAIAATQIGSRS